MIQKDRKQDVLSGNILIDRPSYAIRQSLFPFLRRYFENFKEFLNNGRWKIAEAAVFVEKLFCGCSLKVYVLRKVR